MRTHRTSSSRISAAVPGIESRPGVLELARATPATDMPALADAVAISMGEKACTCMPGCRGLHRAHDVGVRRGVQVRGDPALQADLGGAELLRLGGPSPTSSSESV